MLTGHTDEAIQARGLNLGADGFLTKPFGHLALLAYIKAVLRRAELPPPADALPDFEAGDLAVNFQSQQATVRGVPLNLTPLEYRLLAHLVRNAGRVLPHRALLDRVWGSDYGATTDYLKVFISRLRSKLAGAGYPAAIETVPRLGYRFVRPGAAAASSPAASRPGQPAPLPVDAIDPSPEAWDSRRAYDATRLEELAASIQEHGVLEPILVAPAGDRYRVIAGNRRLRAAARVGLGLIPALVRPGLDEQASFLVNLVENVQRVDLRPTEKVAAIRRLAASGCGVREIARATGLSPGTISKWVRIAASPLLLEALETGRIDLFRAMHLVVVRDEARLRALLDVAPHISPEELYAQARAGVATRNTPTIDARRLAEVEQRLALVRTRTPGTRAQLERIRAQIDRLLEDGQS
jgi:ParB/RepB/Spo0J family partition protein